MPKWTKQTYEMVANELHEATHEVERRPYSPEQAFGAQQAILTIAFNLADVFARDNYGFNRTKFIEAVETGNHIRKALKG